MICNSRSAFSRFLTALLCAALVFTGVPFSPAQGQSGGTRITGKPSPNLPDLNTIRNQTPVNPTQRTPTPATHCRHFDSACRARTGQAQDPAPAADREFKKSSARLDTLPSPAASQGETESRNAALSLPVPGRAAGGNDSPPHRAASVALSSENDFATARVDEINRTGSPGEDLYSGNFRWGTPLVSLPGRAGFDLNLTLYYNSLVWLKAGSSMRFDHDQSWLNPGFSLGFPVIKGPYVNTQTGLSSYLMLTPAGGAVELRQISSSPLVYEARDGSFTQLTFTVTGDQVLTMTDGTSYTYTLGHSIFIKDRNGNYMYVYMRQVDGRDTYDTIVDSLGRSLKFNYGTYDDLQTITQNWDGATTPKTLVTFHHTNVTLNTSFQSGLTLDNVSNGIPISVLDSIDFLDGTTYKFLYNDYAQVKEVQRYDGVYPNNLHAKVAYNLPATATAQDNCPRFTTRSDYAADWNNGNWAVTSFCFNDSNCPWTATHNWGSATTPDGTKHKEYFGTAGAQRGLPFLMETYEGLVLKKWTETTWQSGSGCPAGYVCNPQVIETNIKDDTNGDGMFDKRRRTVFQYTSFNLPTAIIEHKEDATSILRKTVISYLSSSVVSGVYYDKRIIGLPERRELRDAGNALLSKVEYVYDEGSVQSLPILSPCLSATATMHLNPAYTVGRGNLTTMRRYDVTDPNNNNGTAVANKLSYFITGAVASTKDGENHETKYDYTDKFLSRTDNQTVKCYNTFAYPTTITVTDPNPLNTTIQYHYALGVVRRTTDPKGAATLSEYDQFGRLQKVTNEVNGAYTRYVYGNNDVYSYVQTYTTIESGQGEFYAIAFVDGHGRQRGTVSEHLGSVGGYKAVYRSYDNLGRPSFLSNPTEIDSGWLPAGDDAVNGSGGGWWLTQQTYDWNSRPLVTTNQDGTTRTISYDGCGCAGGQTETLEDEGTLVDGVLKKRRQKVFHDVLGRVSKVQSLDWDGNVYATTVNTYNERDQLIYQREFQQGTTQSQDEATTCPDSTTCQRTKLVYDGHGRVQQRWLPIYCTPQSTGSTDCNETAPYETYSYHKDDTVHTATDPRNASTTYGYNSRHLVTNLTYGVPSGVEPTPNVTIAYDAAGQRDWLDDGTQAAGQHAVDYVYDTLSRLQSETRTFNGLSGSFQLSYTYNLAGQVKTITDNRFNTVLTYNYDKAGQVSSLTGTGYEGGGQTNFTSTSQLVAYRAWGGIRDLYYGNGLKSSYDYNTRLQPKLYRLLNAQSQAVHDGSDYQYYPDGRIKFASNMVAQNPLLTVASAFDRAYAYDHVGRLAQALSGPEARGEAPPAPPYPSVNLSPYKQINSYDVWGNLTGRGSSTSTNRFWRGGPYDSATYVNNRRQLWQYDNAGNVLNTGFVISSYDAASRNVYIENWNPPTGGGQTGNPSLPSIDISQSVDSEGRPAKRVETKRTESAPDQNGHTQVTTTVTTTYYVRSSITSDVFSELDEQGNKRKGYVHAFGARLAEQTQNGLSPYVSWRHTNPVTGTLLKGSERTEFDPLGAEVGNYDPYYNDPTPTYLEMKGSEPLYIEGGDPFDLRGGCTLDGLPISCSQFLRRVENGSVQAQNPQGIASDVRHLGGGLIQGYSYRFAGVGYLRDGEDNWAQVRVFDQVRFSAQIGQRRGQQGHGAGIWGAIAGVFANALILQQGTDYVKEYDKELDRLKNLTNCLKAANREYKEAMKKIYEIYNAKFNGAVKEMNPFTPLNLAEETGAAGLGLLYEYLKTGAVSFRGGLIGFGAGVGGKFLVNLVRADYYALYPDYRRHHVEGPKHREQFAECERKYGTLHSAYIHSSIITKLMGEN